jgi:hypothetical protein
MKRSFYDPLTGRGVSERTFLSRVATYQEEREVAADRLDYIISRYESAPSEGSARYWTRKLGNARLTLDAYDGALFDMEQQAEAQYETQVRVPPPLRREEERYDEWEFGTDYKASRRGSDVQVNVRLTFDEPVTQREARSTIKNIVEGGGIPSGVDVASVDWRRKEGRWRHGGEKELDNFLPVLYVGGVEYLRAGAVKPDKL